jgi:hypothetical protein
MGARNLDTPLLCSEKFSYLWVAALLIAIAIAIVIAASFSCLS